MIMIIKEYVIDSTDISKISFVFLAQLSALLLLRMFYKNVLKIPFNM